MNPTEHHPSHIAFEGYRRLASGPLAVVALAVKRAMEGTTSGPVLVFDNATGRTIDIDTRGSDADIVERFREEGGAADAADQEDTPEAPRGRGRPKLGVVAREVTLLPRHWDWLAQQPGGASVALRKLVEEARRANADGDNRRQARERAYHFMSAMAGDLPGFEEAARALFADERERLGEWIAGWPEDVRGHVVWLGFGEGAGERGEQVER